MQVALITENIDLRGVKSFHEYRSYYTILMLCTAIKNGIYFTHDMTLILFIYLIFLQMHLLKKRTKREKTLDKLF